MKMNKRWFLAVSVATMLTANGLVMAATTSDKQENLNEKRPTTVAKGDFMKKGGMKGSHGDHKALLEFLKLDAQTFQAAMKDGKSFVTIAKEQGISEQELKEFMVEQMSKHVEQKEKEGRGPDHKVKLTKADIEKRVSDMINGKAPMRGHGPMGHTPFDNSKLLQLLKIDDASFKTEMKAGKSLVAIAKDHDVSEQTLKDFMINQKNQRIDEAVKAGRIQEDKAVQMKANIEKHVSDMINGKGPMHNREHQPKN
jgi:hypothetical protein